MMEEDLGRGFFKAAFHPSMVLPGDRRGIENIAAWTAFWNEDRRSRLQQALTVVSTELGLKPEVFDSFSRLTTTAVYRPIEIPESVLPLLGIYRAAANDGAGWIQFTRLVPGDGYRPETLYERYAGNGLARLLDPAFFSFKLGDYLKQTFVRMFLIIGASVTLLILIFFWDLWLALTALAPIAFAVSATLGTLTLIGHPLDVPGLMLSIVILGMGIDYVLFFVRAHQRYRDPTHPSVVMIRTAVFLAAASTLIGFGSLMTAEHRLLNSAGLTCFLGIFYSFLGTVLILPPLLERLFRPVDTCGDDPVDDNKRRRRLWRRFRHMEALPRLQAYLQLRDDPFWEEIGPLPAGVRSAIAIGTGTGLPLAWLLEGVPGVRIYAVEPHFERARVAALLIGERGQVQCRPEMEFPDPAGGADLVLLIDVSETLTDDLLDQTLQRLRGVSNDDALGIIRIRPGAPETWGATFARRSADLFQRRRPMHLRSPREMEARLTRNGYRLVDHRPSGDGRRGTWLLFRPQAR
jgi:hypothetical protein